MEVLTLVYANFSSTHRSFTIGKASGFGSPACFIGIAPAMMGALSTGRQEQELVAVRPTMAGLPVVRFATACILEEQTQCYVR